MGLMYVLTLLLAFSRKSWKACLLTYFGCDEFEKSPFKAEFCDLGGPKASFIRRLIGINTRWPPYDLPIIILCLITLEKIKIEKCIRYKNNQNCIDNTIQSHL